MAETQLRIPNFAFKFLADLASKRSLLAKVVSEAAKLSAGVSETEVDEEVAKATGLSEADVQSVRKALSHVRELTTHFELSPAELVSTLSENLEEQASEAWKESHLNDWKSGADEITRALESVIADHPMSVAVKARQLAYAYQSILHRARILTDVRPVFSEDGSRILRNVVTHVLEITYSGDDRVNRVAHFTADATDIARLLAQCERAQRKTSVIEEQFGNIAPTKTIEN